jgi:hypothetical protein
VTGQSTAAKSLINPSKEEVGLQETIAGFAFNPLGFVNFIFPWGEAGTRLASEPGPDDWQIDVLSDMGDALVSGQDPATATGSAIQVAVASGHGIGKTALVAWIIHWFQSCYEFNQTVVTANTKTQLTTKTWRELAKWHKLALNAHWFEWTATQYKHVLHPETWFASAIPWSAHNSEAFAGTHEKWVLLIFDEASRIDDRIWEVAEGAMTTPNAMWICFGNPTQNTGAFAECFRRQKHRWITRQVDSRTARMTNKVKLQQWVDDYGEDSDFVRVRVRGVFPRAGTNQLIGTDLVLEAQRRHPDVELPPELQRNRPGLCVLDEEKARVMGLDVARHGDDQSVAAFRQGLYTWPMKRYRIADLMQLAYRFAEDIDAFTPDAVFVDVTGMGWGVYDKLREIRPDVSFYPVQVGEEAIDPRKFFNKRAEVWWRLREALAAGMSLPPTESGQLDRELEDDLIGPEYGYDPRERVQLEKKEDMKERGLASPDSGDALAITFAATVTAKIRPKKKTWRDRLRERGSAYVRPDTTPQSARSQPCASQSGGYSSPFSSAAMPAPSSSAWCRSQPAVPRTMTNHSKEASPNETLCRHGRTGTRRQRIERQRRACGHRHAQLGRGQRPAERLDVHEPHGVPGCGFVLSRDVRDDVRQRARRGNAQELRPRLLARARLKNERPTVEAVSPSRNWSRNRVAVCGAWPHTWNRTASNPQPRGIVTLGRLDRSTAGRLCNDGRDST